MKRALLLAVLVSCSSTPTDPLSIARINYCNGIAVAIAQGERMDAGLDTPTEARSTVRTILQELKRAEAALGGSATLITTQAGRTASQYVGEALDKIPRGTHPRNKSQLSDAAATLKELEPALLARVSYCAVKARPSNSS